jgi:hypothetical protein
MKTSGMTLTIMVTIILAIVPIQFLLHIDHHKDHIEELQTRIEKLEKQVAEEKERAEINQNTLSLQLDLIRDL